MENIIDIYNDYSSKNKIADKKFYKAIASILIKEKELDEYIKKISFDNLFVTSKTAYSLRDKKMLINERIIHKYIFNKVFSQVTLDNNYKYYLYNSCCLFAIIHELEHANQALKISLKNNNLEYKLLRISLYNFYKYNELNWLGKKNYALTGIINDSKYNAFKDLLFDYNKKAHSIAPHQRLANYYAYQEVNDILLSVNEDITRVIAYFNSLFHFNNFNDKSGFKDDLPPTLKYLKHLEELNIEPINEFIDNDLKVLIKKTQENDNERVKFGL